MYLFYVFSMRGISDKNGKMRKIFSLCLHSYFLRNGFFFCSLQKILLLLIRIRIQSKKVLKALTTLTSGEFAPKKDERTTNDDLPLKDLAVSID